MVACQTTRKVEKKSDISDCRFTTLGELESWIGLREATVDRATYIACRMKQTVNRRMMSRCERADWDDGNSLVRESACLIGRTPPLYSDSFLVRS